MATSPTLWTRDFVFAYLGNFLLFASLYMLLPVLPMYMVGQFGTTLSISGVILALFSVSMFLLGPFYSYLVDEFKRQNVCVVSLLAVISVFGGYTLVGSLLWMAVLRTVQGALFGVTTTMGSTLAIDITTSVRRSEGNICFSWASRLGMVFGPMIGLLFYKYQGLEMVIYTSFGMGLVSSFLMWIIRVPFRAPIGARLCSMDRFILPKGILPGLNLMLVSFVFGALLTTINLYDESINMETVTIGFFGLMGVGLILSMIAARLIFVNADIRAQVVSGLLLIGISLLLIITHPELKALATAAVMLGLGFGLVASDFLLIFVKLSEHCQRGTANTSYLLSWELGIALGVATGCYLAEVSSFNSVFQAGIVATVAALIYYLTVTNRYFRKNRVR